ncbi:FAD-binding protein [Kribbella sp. NBC_00382]|uniref:FAD-binding protein n=1 Tax=Kribbella sp. NBC_00382 TaxID=2975967 RepID=UPI002E22A8C0
MAPNKLNGPSTCTPEVSLQGEYSVDLASRERVSQDAGRYRTKVPQGVLRPASVEDIQEIVRRCAQQGIPVVARGLANTTDGQGLTDGVLIDMTALNTIHEIGDDYAIVDAGVDWLQLTNAAHAKGLAPPALTGFLGLTLGGTLSLGGIPPAIQSGGQVDSVIELEVVTGTGELRTCSAEHDKELFEAVLAGLGQYGIITRATVRLGIAPERVRGHELSYSEMSEFFRDFRTLLHRSEVSELYGEFGDGQHLSAFTFHETATPPDDQHVLRDLTPTETAISDNDFLPHVTRIDVAVEQLREALDWDHRAKPWFTVWLPETHAERYVTEVVQGLTPDDIGDGGFVLLYAHRRAKLTRPSLRLPEQDDSDWVYLFTLMTATATFSEDLLARNRRLYDRARALGGTRYPIESVAFTQADWADHYGDRWPHLQQVKHTTDPAGILTPGPGIF